MADGHDERNDVEWALLKLSYKEWPKQDADDEWNQWLAWCVWHGTPTVSDPLYAEDRLFRISGYFGIPAELDIYAYRWGNSHVSWQCSPALTGEQLGTAGQHLTPIHYSNPHSFGVRQVSEYWVNKYGYFMHAEESYLERHGYAGLSSEDLL